MARKKSSKSNSLFELLSAQSQYLVDAADILTRIISADPQERITLNEELHKVEHGADTACHTVLNKINQSFVLPFDREDLYALSNVIDDCVDFMDEAGDNIILYKPGRLPEGVFTQVEILRNCAALTKKTMGKLAVIDASTRDYWIEINQLENQGDQVYRSMVSTLFGEATDALEALKVKMVLDTLEEAIDAFEKLSGTVESIAIKES
ncbi:MAG: DUF47 family protein [Ancrocorticia sp.]|nr:DUF47 family protein [Ancrocorticia sp.]MCI1896421.1 DUF47 family protein [Ancrocorticia sp.]MCI1932614.1 DUF47 family protein [Ancrocorticia sp.]MCI1962571.1 DUF47 family protein [Ancrocorticia sp.]MCI2002500.1 DUF47 family protein [Ancrocorticia sp.]